MQFQVGKDHLRCTKVLTDAAKFIISKELESGIYEEKIHRKEPPFMAPSQDPDDYSIVCLKFGLLFIVAVANHL